VVGAQSREDYKKMENQLKSINTNKQKENIRVNSCNSWANIIFFEETGILWSDIMILVEKLLQLHYTFCVYTHRR
jgi:D-ribose pyranose/furanose isomerase RbsD